MTHSQKDAVRQILREFQSEGLAHEVHHGDCVGADDEFANLAAEVFRHLGCIVCHPPMDETHRAFNKNFNEMREKKTHFARNRDIVNETSVLIACPCETEHQSHGGTWYTIDYAKKQGKRVLVVWPDGTILVENGEML